MLPPASAGKALAAMGGDLPRRHISMQCMVEQALAATPLRRRLLSLFLRHNHAGARQFVKIITGSLLGFRAGESETFAVGAPRKMRSNAVEAGVVELKAGSAGVCVCQRGGGDTAGCLPSNYYVAMRK